MGAGQYHPCVVDCMGVKATMNDDSYSAGHTALQMDAHHQRQARIIHPRMAEAVVLIAGLGMIGGWTAMVLARAVGMLHLIDPDVVEDVNIGCQPYTAMQVGEAKALALAQLLNGFDVRQQIGNFPGVDGTRVYVDPRPSILISAVDSMAGRRANAEWSRDHNIPLYLDGRILGELAVVATAFDPASYESYLAALPGDDEVPDVPCGQAGTGYTGMWVASRIAAVINQFCKGSMPKPMEVYHVGAGVDVPQPGA